MSMEGSQILQEKLTSVFPIYSDSEWIATLVASQSNKKTARELTMNNFVLKIVLHGPQFDEALHNGET